MAFYLRKKIKDKKSRKDFNYHFAILFAITSNVLLIFHTHQGMEIEEKKEFLLEYQGPRKIQALMNDSTIDCERLSADKKKFLEAFSQEIKEYTLLPSQSINFFMSLLLNDEYKYDSRSSLLTTLNECIKSIKKLIMPDFQLRKHENMLAVLLLKHIKQSQSLVLLDFIKNIIQINAHPSIKRKPSTKQNESDKDENTYDSSGQSATDCIVPHSLAIPMDCHRYTIKTLPDVFEHKKEIVENFTQEVLEQSKTVFQKSITYFYQNLLIEEDLDQALELNLFTENHKNTRDFVKLLHLELTANIFRIIRYKMWHQHTLQKRMATQMQPFFAWADAKLIEEKNRKK